MKIKKFICFSFLLILTTIYTTGNVSAADFRIADKDNGNINVEQGEKIKNLYTVGNMVSIDTNIQKGLHAAGNVVTINGEIGGTVYSGAGTLFINGNVEGSVHGVGGSVVIKNKITDDLLLAGGNIVIAKTASIGGDLFIGGGTIDIQGTILGNAHIGGGTITINGEINGNVKIIGSDRLILGSSAKINGDLEYRSKKEIEIREGAIVLGETTMTDKKGLLNDDSKKATILSIIFIILSVSILIKIGGSIVVGLILIYLFRNLTKKVVNESLNNFWKSLGVGLVVLIIVPIISIMLMITLIGIWLGIIIGMVYILSIFIAAALASIIFGSWLTKVIRKRKDYSVNWKVVVGGVIALTLVGLIPIVGWITAIAFLLISLGSTYRLAYKMRK